MQGEVTPHKFLMWDFGLNCEQFFVTWSIQQACVNPSKDDHKKDQGNGACFRRSYKQTVKTVLLDYLLSRLQRTPNGAAQPAMAQLRAPV